MGKLLQNLKEGDKLYHYVNGKLYVYPVVNNDWHSVKFNARYFSLNPKDYRISIPFTVRVKDGVKDVDIYFGGSECDEEITCSNKFIDGKCHLCVYSSSIEKIRDFFEKELENAIKYKQESIKNAEFRIEQANKRIECLKNFK